MTLLLLILGIIFLFIIPTLGIILICLWLFITFWKTFMLIFETLFQALIAIGKGIYQLIRLMLGKKVEKKEEENINPQEKKCEYCKSIIDRKAKVCPICKKELNTGIKDIIRAIFVLLVLAGLVAYFCIAF